MYCQQCGQENPPEARFCMRCGGGLRMPCPQCGTELPHTPELRFCFSCGADLRTRPFEPTSRVPGPAGREGEERRPVTVLFADLVGFTATSERLDPEDVRELQDAYFSAVRQPIEAYGGAVEKYIGDAVLAVFGVPQAHEEDPERAVRAALAMQQAMTTLNDRLAKSATATPDLSPSARPVPTRLPALLTSEALTSASPPLSLRIGVHTGLVVSRVDKQGNFAVSGDTVNRAFRLQAAAEAGTVLVSAETHKLISHVFDCEPLDSVQIKGKAELAQVFRVVEARPTASKLRGLAGLASPLVGRQAEVAALHEALDRLQHGVGGIVTVVGEAGIGKSRLVAEARRSADQPAGQSLRSSPKRRPSEALSQLYNLAIPQWIEGRCLSYGGAIAYLLWLDLLRNALGRTLDDPPETVCEVMHQWVERLCPGCVDEVYPYLGQLMALPMPSEVAAKIVELEGDELKRRTFQAVDTVIASAAGRQPLVVVCEDLHWADSSSLELLEHVLRLTDQTGLLVVCIFRPEPEHGSWRLREAVARHYRHRHTDLWLQPLSAGDSEILVTNLLASGLSPVEVGPRGIPSKLIYRILAQAEGNPFYVEEVLRTLIDGGLLVRDDAGRWAITRDVAEIELPATLQGVLMARIDRLEDDTRRVLQLAAVIGRIFLYRVLAEIATEEQALDEKLLTLQRQELIRERTRIPELEYIFKHELTREAAYSGILKKQRRLFHRQVAEALERLFPDRIDELLGLLAHHWERTEDADKAVEYLLRAGDQARLAYAQDEALGYYQRALAVVEPAGDHAAMARVMMRVGLTYHNAFDSERAQQAYDQAFALWHTRLAPVLPPAPHALRLAASWGLRNIDPLTRWNVADAFWQFKLLAGLIHITVSGEVVPELATRWDILDGGRTYVFKIHDQARWSDGVPVTAHDFEYSWKRIVHRNLRLSGLLADVKGVEEFRQGQPAELGFRTLDDKTLVVELVEPRGNFLPLLSCSPLLPVPRHVVDLYGDAWGEPQTLVGNGPYMLADWQPDGTTTLVRNPTFPGFLEGNVDRIDVLHRPPDTSSLPLYIEGRLDFLGLERANLERARHDCGEHYHVKPEAAVWYVFFESQRSPFEDLRVRQAFALAIDKASLPTVVMGFALPATGGFVPKGVPGHAPGIGPAHDVELARQLLERAGYSGGRGFPCITVGVNELVMDTTGISLQDQWRRHLGIEVVLQPWTTVQFFDDLGQIREACHAWVYGWGADYLDPDNFLRNWFSTIAPQNDPDISPFSQLASKAQRQTDPVRRLKLYQEADKLLMAEATVVPITYSLAHYLMKPWLREPKGAVRMPGPRQLIIVPH